jgi:hypothetical protein
LSDVESHDKATDIWQMPGPAAAGGRASLITPPLWSFLADLAKDVRDKTESQPFPAGRGA